MAGTNNSLNNSSSTITVANSFNVSTAGRMTNTNQPAFFYYVATNVANVTGNGATYQLGTSALTKIYDNGSNCTTAGVFTAPVTGIYKLDFAAFFNNASIATIFISYITTTGNTFETLWTRAPSAANGSCFMSVQCKMTSGDTATFSANVQGEAGNSLQICSPTALGGNVASWIAGYLIC